MHQRDIRIIRLVYSESLLSHKLYAYAFNAFSVQPVVCSEMIPDMKSTGRDFAGACSCAREHGFPTFIT
jgi:hypothetical protein